MWHFSRNIYNFASPVVTGSANDEDDMLTAMMIIMMMMMIAVHFAVYGIVLLSMM